MFDIHYTKQFYAQIYSKRNFVYVLQLSISPASCLVLKWGRGANIWTNDKVFPVRSPQYLVAESNIQFKMMQDV